MGEVNRARADRLARNTGHRADDSRCAYWAGDFAGVDLRAICDICREGRTVPSMVIESPRRISRG